MVIRSREVSGIGLTLLLFGVLPLVFHIQPVEAAVLEATVTYDYYVVAGYGMVPTPPSSLAPSPRGFNFTIDPPVFNCGNTTYYGGRTYLYDGFAYSRYTNMTRYGPPMSGAKVHITPLRYDITILNLTAEVIDGTYTEKTIFIWSWFDNWTIVHVDTLDPWDPTLPGYDEVDYYTGKVEVNRLVDGDRYNKIRPDIPPDQWDTLAPGYSNQGPGSLLEPDMNGDAAATGHVAPIPVANGTTFTEYFGPLIFGDADVGTQINGTIRLRLRFQYVVPGPPEASFTYTPTEPRFNETVTFDASLSYDSDGTITSYLWNFGDGSTASGRIANHAYTTAGNHTVILNVTDNEGYWDTGTAVIAIADPEAPPPEFPWLWVAVVIAIVGVATGAIGVRRKRARA